MFNEVSPSGGNVFVSPSVSGCCCCCCCCCVICMESHVPCSLMDNSMVQLVRRTGLLGCSIDVVVAFRVMLGRLRLVVSTSTVVIVVEEISSVNN